jgi:hypothetical protein
MVKGREADSPILANPKAWHFAIARELLEGLHVDSETFRRFVGKKQGVKIVCSRVHSLRLS